MIRFLLSRIGCLMMGVGIVFLAIGIAAVQSDQPALNFLFIGSAGTFLGFLLWNRLRERTPRKPRSENPRRNKPRQGDEQDHPWENGFYE